MELLSSVVATEQLKLRFFNLEVTIHSDSHAYLDLFARMYRRFQPVGAPAPAQEAVDFTVLARPDNPWGRPVMILDGEVWPINDPHLLVGYTYEGVLNAIVASVRSHFLIHAGVVSFGGQGLILAAESGHGKTTLVLELVRRGFKFLSDEMAALGRVDQQVHPFPRSLRIRPGTLELAGCPEAGVDAPQWLGKMLLDIDQISPGSLGPAAAISHVVILRNPAAAEGRRADAADGELRVLVDRLDAGFLAAVRRLSGVREVRLDEDRGYPLLRLRAAGKGRMFMLSQVENLCRQRRILILDLIKRTTNQPTFDAEPRLEAISQSQAVAELLRHFRGGHQSAILRDEFKGSSPRLFMELAVLVGQANCYQLTVGPLPKMADLMCDLVGALAMNAT